MIFQFPFRCAVGVAIALTILFASAAGKASPSESLAPDAGAAMKSAKSRFLVEAKASSKKTEAKGDDAKKAGKPVQVGNYGDWGAFVAQGGKDKTCYALASPKERAPAGLKRDPAYVFISNRPGENVRGEVSIIMGYGVKQGGAARAEVGESKFDLVAKGNNAWIKNAAEEPHFVEALKKGSKLIIKAPSLKGNVTTDSYSLSGLSQALEKVQKECP